MNSWSHYGLVKVLIVKLKQVKDEYKFSQTYKTDSSNSRISPLVQEELDWF